MSSVTERTHAIPKAILYWNPTSVWSTVPRLALYEKGYNDDDVVLREVDISKGDNFSPGYLRINQHGTIPTLVVPIMETTGSGMETRYRSFKDTMSILSFLDSSRTSSRGSHSHPGSADDGYNAPAPTLSPATIEGKHLADTITLAVHLSSADPNFLLLAARNGHELMLKENGFPGKWINARQDALTRFRDQLDNGSTGRTFLERKLAANSVLYDIYFSPHSGEETESRRNIFFTASRKAWETGVVEVLQTLEDEVVGPYALGDHVSLADLHCIAWLARLIFLSQGTPTADGLEALEKQISGDGIGLGGSAAGGEAPAKFKIGPKVRAMWIAWTKRESFKKVYGEGLH